jgi:diguanylate cyclase (GGDEF)-like protein
MLTIYNCIATQHDLRLVVLAALVCALASFAAVCLLHHLGHTERRLHRVWLAVAAVTTGFGIWATHFIAMLAFQPGIPSGYNIALTAVSLVVAVGLTGVGLVISISPGVKYGRWIGGAVVGGGIAGMHYTGMAAFEIEGRIVWDPALVIISIALGGMFGAAALDVALRENRVIWKVIGALLLTIAICSHHFTAMGAAAIMPDPRIVVSAAAVPAGLLAIGVALVSTAIIILAFAGLALDLRDRRIANETAHMRDLANAAVEGLIVCDEGEVVAANLSFTRLACAGGSEAVGRLLSSFFPTVSSDDLACAVSRPVEAALSTEDGTAIPVELIQRRIIYAGKPHQALAIRDIRERKKAEQDIHFLAHHDPLTKLPNRMNFNKRLDNDIASHRGTERCLAVLFLDLDRFKEINDLFGHLTGDAVLQFVAEKVRQVLKPESMIARFGGDEFAVIVPRLPSPAYAKRTAEAIMKAINNEDASISSGPTVRTSIGIAVFPKDADDRATLLSHADAALYEAKADGAGSYRFFEPSMGAHLRDRRQLEHDIRHAISREQLRLVYQPQADVRSNSTWGFEALLRWDHPTRGEIPPSEFIPIAEDCGAILQIGEWVVRTACAEAARWDNPLSVAVNVSAVQLHAGNFPDLIEAVLFQTGLEPSRLELEITESALIKDKGRALTALRKLKALGVRVAMDDFGTGYSSLSNLRAFPFDKIKIDQSFVRSVETSGEAAAIVRAVVGLARGFNLPVVAEGVETTAELNFLRSEACSAIQGYLLARPAPISEFAHHTSRQQAVASAKLRKRQLTIV